MWELSTDVLPQLKYDALDLLVLPVYQSFAVQIEITLFSRSNVPVHPLLEDLGDRQLGFSRRATGLLGGSQLGVTFCHTSAAINLDKCPTFVVAITTSGT
jgi:hypothetical protein